MNNLIINMTIPSNNTPQTICKFQIGVAIQRIKAYHGLS